MDNAQIARVHLDGNDWIKVHKAVAKAIGLNEAVFVQGLHYRINWVLEHPDPDEIARHTFDGHVWVYNSYAMWRDNDFPFWSEDTIYRAAGSLTRKGIVLTKERRRENGRQLGHWYTVNYDALGAAILAVLADNRTPNRRLKDETISLRISDDYAAPQHAEQSTAPQHAEVAAPQHAEPTKNTPSKEDPITNVIGSTDPLTPVVRVSPKIAGQSLGVKRVDYSSFGSEDTNPADDLSKLERTIVVKLGLKPKTDENGVKFIIAKSHRAELVKPVEHYSHRQNEWTTYPSPIQKYDSDPAFRQWVDEYLIRNMLGKLGPDNRFATVSVKSVVSAVRNYGAFFAYLYAGEEAGEAPVARKQSTGTEGYDPLDIEYPELDDDE